MNFILGASGRLGQAISSSFSDSDRVAMGRSNYAEWWRDGAADHISKYLSRNAKSEGIVYVAAGLIDPNLPSVQHMEANFKLARNVIRGATKLGFKVVTFGTVMESVVNAKQTNPYISSKIRLGKFVEEFSSKSDLVVHVRLHTLFGGGPPEKFMFLGQIFRSILNQSEFKMSPGLQLREYHHLDDDVTAIKLLVASGITGTIALSHGNPVTLKDMALFIFRAFNCQENLRIGALPEPVSDNYDLVFEPHAALGGNVFREPLQALVDYLSICMQLSNED